MSDALGLQVLVRTMGRLSGWGGQEGEWEAVWVSKGTVFPSPRSVSARNPGRLLLKCQPRASVIRAAVWAAFQRRPQETLKALLGPKQAAPCFHCRAIQGF